MITWLRNAGAQEAKFYSLVAAEAGAAAPEVHSIPDVVRVAVHDGQVSGFAAMTLDPEPDRDAALDFLFVHERWRGSGVGRLLLFDLHRCAQLAGTAGIAIVAHPSTSQFFTKVGEVRTGTRSACAGTAWASPLFRFCGGRDAVDQRRSVEIAQIHVKSR